MVIKSTGSWYKVLDEANQIWNCRIRGKLRTKDIKSTNPVAVGDSVVFDTEDKNRYEGVIKSINKRLNYIVRKSINLSKRSHILAANIDHVYLLVTLVAPETTTGFIDRFLVSAEAYHIPVTLLFNKIDLFNGDELEIIEEFKETYSSIGYPCYNISATDPKSVEFLKNEIKGNKVMFGGHSGVGKSTLVNALDPNLAIKTSDISEANLSGQHTTTFAEMHPLPSGGFIIDTPGVRAFGLIDFEKASLGHYFPEISELMGHCKFNNCLHINEPHCAVKEAVENEYISSSRYENYLQMYHDDDTENYRESLYRK
ncbi:MAG: ribosome small subunit-dependent GTPase A [Crocinitomicaceae bacterium]